MSMHWQGKFLRYETYASALTVNSSILSSRSLLHSSMGNGEGSPA